jgi:hypothetical protein
MLLIAVNDWPSKTWRSRVIVTESGTSRRWVVCGRFLRGYSPCRAFEVGITPDRRSARAASDQDVAGGIPRRLSRASVMRVLRPRSSVSSTGQSRALGARLVTYADDLVILWRRGKAGIRSKTLKPGGMIADGGRPAAKIAIVGWKVDGSSSEPAYNVYESDLPISPPNTRLMQTEQRFRTRRCRSPLPTRLSAGRPRRKSGSPASLPKRFRAYEFASISARASAPREGLGSARSNERSPKAAARSLPDTTVQWLGWLNALARGRTESERTPWAP